MEHAIQRAEERYGLLLNAEDMEDLRFLVLNHPVYNARIPTIALTLEYKGQYVRIIFDNRRQTVSTFLT